MSSSTVTRDIDNLSYDKKDYEKIINIYLDITSELKLCGCMTTKDDPIVSMIESTQTRSNSYDWKLHKCNNSILFFQMYSDMDKSLEPLKNKPKSYNSHLSLNNKIEEFRIEEACKMTITMIYPTDKIINTIDKILNNYPK